MRQRFNAVADRITSALGSLPALAAAAVVIVVWALSGPVFGFSDTWQLAINTGTTIVTFLMVFVIQNGQNRQTKALHLKLDEVIRAVEGARNEFIRLDAAPEDEIARLEQEIVEVADAEANGGVVTVERRITARKPRAPRRTRPVNGAAGEGGTGRRRSARR